MSKTTWNRLAAEFEVAVCDVTRSSGRQVAELVKRARPAKSTTLIDAGCGIGSFVNRFGRRFGSVLAFDFAAKMVNRAKRRCAGVPNVRWATMGLEDAAEKLGPVGDLVSCLNVITSTDADLRRRQWTSLAGLPKPGGMVLVVVPSLESARRVVKYAEADNKIHESNFDAGLVYRGDDRQKHYSRDELRKILQGEGLRVLSLKRVRYPWADDGCDDPGLQPPWSWLVLARKRMRTTTA